MAIFDPAHPKTIQRFYISSGYYVPNVNLICLTVLKIWCPQHFTTAPYTNHIQIKKGNNFVTNGSIQKPKTIDLLSFHTDLHM